MSSYAKRMQGIVREYQGAGKPWPASVREMATWAIETNRWRVHRSTEIEACARDLARALREEYYTDQQGRRVRLKHPVSVRRNDTQMVLWDDIRTAPRSHMDLAFQQRRTQIVGDCRQLKTDVDSYNDAHADEPPIQFVLDFTKDVAELEATERGPFSPTLAGSSSNEPKRRVWRSRPALQGSES
jgi:hypothetical protein